MLQTIFHSVGFVKTNHLPVYSLQDMLGVSVNGESFCLQDFGLSDNCIIPVDDIVFIKEKQFHDLHLTFDSVKEVYLHSCLKHPIEVNNSVKNIGKKRKRHTFDVGIDCELCHMPFATVESLRKHHKKFHPTVKWQDYIKRSCLQKIISHPSSGF